MSVGMGEEWSRMVANPAIMDIKFSDQPLGEDETRELLKEMFDFVEHMSVEDSELYKYVMDVSILPLPCIDTEILTKFAS